MIQQFDVVLDVTNLRCPMPLLKAKQALSSMDVGQILKVVATDAGSWRDIPGFINLSSHKLLDQIHTGTEYHFYIAKGE